MKNNNLVRRWVAALRGGKYKQAKGRLRKEDGYCVLGVLCDLYDPEQWADNGLGWFRKDGTFTTVPGRHIQEAAGMSQRERECLWRSNDLGWTFKRLADYIEERMGK